MEAQLTDPYPLRTKPFFRDYLWGGRKLESVLGKAIPRNGVWAESWEMIDHPEHQSQVINGSLAGSSLRDLAANHRNWFLGDQADRPERLPLLLKYLDCQKVLSVQVHPNDDYAQRMSPPDLGKTEAWYIVSSEPGAKLYAGLRRGVDRQSLADAIQNGGVEECLHVIEPSPGDCVFIPAGTVHALGAGLLVAEIQQASNTTFRLFDWNRVDADGHPRQLHTEQALEVIDFESEPRAVQTPRPTDQAGREQLVYCDMFILDRLQNTPEGTVGGDGKFHLLTAPQGGIQISWPTHNGHHEDTLEKGHSVLLPATMPTTAVSLKEDGAVLLDMYLP